jgi:hypothetical protein
MHLTLGSAGLELLRDASRVGGKIVIETTEQQPPCDCVTTADSVVFAKDARYAIRMPYVFTPREPGASFTLTFRSRSRNRIYQMFDQGLATVSAPGTGEIATVAHAMPGSGWTLAVTVRGACHLEIHGIRIDEARPGVQIVRPPKNLEPVRNPGKGWVVHFYDNTLDAYGTHIDPSRPFPFPGAGCAYFRLAWAYLEPEEGRLDLSLIDPWYEYFTRQRMEIAFRITCCEGEPDRAVPDWVVRAGAKMTRFDDPWGGKGEEPDYDDPVLLDKLDGFLRLLAEQYDGDPNVAFIDVGSIGIWGEGHTLCSTKRRVPFEVHKKHIDLHRKHFTRTFVLVNDDATQKPVEYAAAVGLGLRDDSVCVDRAPGQYFAHEMAEWFWRRAPVVIETQHYQAAVDSRSWDSAVVLRTVELYHASYLSIHAWPEEFLAAEPALVREAANRMGYLLCLDEIELPSVAEAGQPIVIRCSWSNQGVGPVYEPYVLLFGLKDADGRVVAVEADAKHDLRTWTPGGPFVTHSVLGIPDPIASGAYHVVVALAKARAPAVPAIALPLEGRETDRWHRVATLAID